MNDPEEPLLQAIPDTPAGRLHAAIIATDFILDGVVLGADDPFRAARFCAAVLTGIAWARRNPEGAMHLLDEVQDQFAAVAGDPDYEGAVAVAEYLDGAYFGMEELRRGMDESDE